MDDYKKQDKQKIGEGDTVRITKARKNEYDEWNVKVFVNGKNYKPAEIFADSKEDAELQAQDAKDLYKRKGAKVVGEKTAPEEKEEKEEIEESSLKEEILKLSGITLLEERGKIVSPKIVKDIERIAERERKGGGKVVFNKGGISVKLANGKSWYFQAGDDANSLTKDLPTNINEEDYIFWIAQGW